MGFPCLGSLSACMRNAKGYLWKRVRKDALFQTGQPDAGGQIGMYVIPLYEEPGEPAQSAEPSLVLELDYQSLGELCLFENYSLLSCKYEKEPILNHFTAQLEKEYDTFFFDEEHTGFTPDSCFFSMLCNAVWR